MRYSLLSQAALIIVSIVIVVGFIKPTLASIQTTDKNVAQYKDAVSKASALNQRLNELVGIEQSFTQDQMTRLQAFIPDTLDTLNVMRQIQAIFDTNGLPITTMNAHPIVSPVANATLNGSKAKTNIPSEVYQDIDVKFSGTYADLKAVLQLAEANQTLLEVSSVTFTSIQSNVISRNITNQTNSNLNGINDFVVTFRAYAMGSTTAITQ